MTGRIVRQADFQRVLRAGKQLRSAHFALHHLAARPGQTSSAPRRRPRAELSTELAPQAVKAVDESAAPTPLPLPGPLTCWLGMVVPKRHARRSVTRTLVKRLVRAAYRRHVGELPAGLWVVRLRAPLEAARFRSASSLLLRTTVRGELDELLGRATHEPIPS